MPETTPVPLAQVARPGPAPLQSQSDQSPVSATGRSSAARQGVGITSRAISADARVPVLRGGRECMAWAHKRGGQMRS